MRTNSTPDLIEVIQPASRTAIVYSEIINASGFDNLAFFQNVGAFTAGTLTGNLYYAATAADLATYNYTTAGDTWVPLRNGAADNVKVAHSFTTGALETPSIYQVTFRLRQEGTLAAGDYIWVSIQGDATGDPDGTAIATSYKIDATAISTASGGELVTFTFRESSVQALTAATAYHIVLEGDYTASSSNQIQIHVDTLASGGTLELYDAAWADVTTQSPPTTCLQVASWTALTAYAFTAVTADNNQVAAYGRQVKVVPTGQYGPYLQYYAAETSAWTALLHDVSALKLDPQYAT